MAEVHLARVAGPAGFEKLLVVKRLLPELAWDPEMSDQFVEEARLAANLSHANIVPVFDFGEVDGSYYLAMEYVEGKNLRALAVRMKKQGRRIPLPAIVYIGAEVCRGLQYAHSRKARDGTPLRIVHRDISPQNVALSYNGDVKILDFGIAKSAEREYRTQAGFVKGKLRYMSPEQAREDRLDGRTDLFAVAVMMHELLTKRREVPDPAQRSLREWLEAAEFARPSSENPEVDDELDLILLRALSADRDLRFPDCGEMERALRAWLARRYPDYGAQDVSMLLRDAFASEIEAEQAWIARSLAAAPEIEENARSSGGDMFVDKSVTRMELEQSGGVGIDTGSLALGGSAATVPPPSSAKIGPAPQAEPPQPTSTPGVEIVDEGTAGWKLDKPFPGKTKPSRGMWMAAVGLGVLFFGGAAAAFFGGLTPWYPATTPAPTASAPPTATPSGVASAPTATPTEKPTRSAAVTHTPKVNWPTRPPTHPPTTAPPTPRPIVARAYITVNVKRGWGAVYVDGHLVKSETPLKHHAVTPGTHLIEVRQGNRSWKKTVYLQRNQSASYVAELK